MKTLRVNAMLMGCFLMMGGTTAFSQQSAPEVPGDHFSLEGALELFKKSTSPEDFEHLLNSENSKVNNLDLNGDNAIDYIKVFDRNEGNVHAFVLQAIVSETESQDVAVIELEKLANGKAVLQITGDADIYGIETIIEPTEEVRINAGTSTARNNVNVWAWPSVQYVYSPYYTTWSSAWSWGMRPIWWSTWRPVSYYTYNPWWQPYRPYYSVCYTHRIGYAQHMYRPYRTTSVMVYNMHHDQLNNYRSSHHDSNYYNRGRDDDRMNGRDNNSYHRDSNGNGRQYSTDNQQRNSRSSGNDWSQRQDQDHRRTSTTNNDTYSRDRSNDVNRSSSGWQRNSGRTQTQESSRWSGLVNPNPVMHQREHNSSIDTRSQRSSVQMDRRGTSGGGLQRSGHGSGGSTSGGQRRGRN